MRNDLRPKVREKYLKKFNNDLESLRDIVTYFAHARNVSIVTMMDIDVEGFDLGYQETTTDGLAEKEIRIQFNNRAETEQDIESHFNVLLKEAHDVFEMVHFVD
jgi:hypothetical protein